MSIFNYVNNLDGSNFEFVLIGFILGVLFIFLVYIIYVFNIKPLNPKIKEVLLILETDEKYAYFRDLKYYYFEKIDLLNVISCNSVSERYYYEIKDAKKYFYEKLIENMRTIARNFDVSIKDLESAVLMNLLIEDLKKY